MTAKFFGFGRWFSPKRALPTVSIKTRHRYRYLRGCELLESRCFLAIGSLATVTPEVWLPLDEGSINIAADYSGHARNATVFGASWTTGRSGTGLSFDGQSNYVNANLDLSRWLGGTGASVFGC